MPVFRNVRRSRRLLKRPPRHPDDDYEWESLDLYPDTPNVVSPNDLESSPRRPSASLPVPPLPSTSLVLPCISLHKPTHSRKRKPGHIPRPPNPFMIFRSHLWEKEKTKTVVERDHRQISRIAGECWNQLSEAERAPYKLLAQAEKQRHAKLYPNYKYMPEGRGQLTRKKTTKGSRPKRQQGEGEISTRVSRPSCEPAQESMGDASSPASEPSPRTPAGYETSMENMTLISDLDLSSSLITQTHPTPTCSYSPPIRDAFVPTSEIPHLSLDGEYRVRDKSGEDSRMRSECDPLFVGNALAGIKAESIPIADRLMLTPYSFDMPTCSGHQESHEPVIFTNPFSENRDVVPTSGVAQQDFEIGDALVYPSSPLELDFGQWVDYDDEE